MSITDNLKVQRWRQEHVLHLAEHFHEFDSKTGQHTRVRQYRLKEDDVKTVQGIWSEITQMAIHLALRKKTPDENTITFVPILTLQTNKELTFEMEVSAESTAEAKNLKGDVMKSSFVPQPYVDMVTENWRTMDFHLLDDLFSVQNKNIPERVMSYHITGNIIKQLAQLDGKNLVEINLYLGVDMNKFSKTTLPSFTPVYGFKFKEASTIDLVRFFQTLTCYKRDDISKMEEIFIQYSSPCPPTCPPFVPPNS